MSESESVRVLIVGGGPAGYSAAIYAGRAGLSPLCVEGYGSGGQIIRSSRIDNFPSHPDGITGTDLAERIRAQAIQHGARLVMADVESVDLSASPFTVVTADRRYLAETVIVATGASSRRLGLRSEDEFDGAGVCYCAICDGPFFAGRRVLVVGGGDAAAEEALQLSKIAVSVLLVHRRGELRASAPMRAALMANPNVTLLTPYVVDEILGQHPEGVTGVRLRHVEHGTHHEEPVDGVFVAIGHEPASALFAPWLRLDEHGFVVTAAGSTATNVPGVFAAGDVADPRYRQAITAAASGCAAAIDAERWLLSGRAEQSSSRGDAVSTLTR